MRAIAFGLAIFGLVAAASAQDIQKLKRTAKSPKELAVQGHVSIDDTCEARDLPEIDLDIPPKGGTVCMRPGMVRLATPWSGRTLHCIGKRISGVFVIYLPFGSFTGLDTMRFTVGREARTYEFEIKVEAGQAPAAGTSSALAEPQKAGPVPQCPALVS